jgi:hypothetical protein
MRYSTLLLPGLIGIILGCGGPTAPAPQPASSDKEQIETAFTTLQSALKDRKAEQIWDLVDKQSQTDAEREAKAWKDHLAKADADKVKKDLGISPEELAKLDGKGFLKTEAFYEKETKELAKVKKIDEVKLEGKDRATVFYPDEDKPGERDHVKFFREGGKWKARLKMEPPPRGVP